MSVFNVNTVTNVKFGVHILWNKFNQSGIVLMSKSNMAAKIQYGGHSFNYFIIYKLCACSISTYMFFGSGNLILILSDVSDVILNAIFQDGGYFRTSEQFAYYFRANFTRFNVRKICALLCPDIGFWDLKKVRFGSLGFSSVFMAAIFQNGGPFMWFLHDNLPIYKLVAIR